jgi:hypothetical protein
MAHTGPMGSLFHTGQQHFAVKQTTTPSGSLFWIGPPKITPKLLVIF